MEIYVENIKCSGCTTLIKNKLNKIYNIEDVVIDVEKGLITLTLPENKRQSITKTLHSLGYPEINSTKGLDKIKTKAKSFVSCAVGKMQ